MTENEFNEKLNRVLDTFFEDVSHLETVAGKNTGLLDAFMLGINEKAKSLLPPGILLMMTEIRD